MAKTIKFNLICDNKPVRTIEDLQNNFSIEDVLEYYSNGLLSRWLKVRGYEKELEKVSKITAESNIEIINRLIEIFNVEDDDQIVKQSVYMLEYLDSRKKSLESYHKENYNKSKIINEYTSGYAKLCADIFQHSDNPALIKSAIADMVSNYMYLLILNRRELFWRLCESKNYLAIMCLLMNENTRDFYLFDPNKNNDSNDKTSNVSDSSEGASPKPFNGISGVTVNGVSLHGVSNIDSIRKLSETVKYSERTASLFSFYSPESKSANAEESTSSFDRDEKKAMHDKICAIIELPEFAEKLGENLHTFAGDTNKYWKDLEPKGKKCMIIKLCLGDYVRSSGNSEEQLGYDDINKKFRILDGIDYESHSNTQKLVYMEV